MVLITGASGFLGQHLVKYLVSKNVNIRALYFNTVPTTVLYQLPGVEWMQCDLLDVFAVEEAMKGITEIYHCAAIVSFDPKTHEKMLHFNVESTTNVVNEALLQGIRKMVHVSSVAAIGRTPNSKKHINEDEEWGESIYNSAYGLSKYLAEIQVWRSIGEGLNVVIVNPGIILGVGNWDSGSAQLIKLAAKEFPFYTTGINSWVDAEDVVSAMYGLMNSKIAAQRYIVSAGNFEYKEIFTLMANAMNKKPPRYKANSLITGLAWRLSKLQSAILHSNSLITKETAITSNQKSYYDNSKLLSALPNFSYTGIEDTIKKMANSYSGQ